MMDPTAELALVPMSTKVRSVICASICNFMIGAYYFFSNINSYVAAYIHQYDETVTSKDTLLIMPLYIVMQSIGSILSIKLSAKYGYSMVSNVSYAIFALGSLIMVFVTNYWMFVFIYGFMNGLVIGTGYMPALCIAWTYFPDKKSIITGVSLFTAGFSASILSPMSTAIVNPNNVKDYEKDPAVYNRVPLLFFCLFLLYGGLVAVGALLQPPPFESQAIKELKKLEEIDKMNKKDNQEVDKKERELSIVSNSPHSIDRPIKTPLLENDHQNAEAGGHNQHITKREMRQVVNEELKNDMRGYVPPEEALAMANMSNTDLANMAITKKSVQALVQDRSNELRQSIRASFNRGHDVRKSIRMRQQDHAFSAKYNEMEAMVNDILNKPTKVMPSIEDDKTFKRSIPQMAGGECPSIKFGLKSWPFICLCVMAYSCSIYNYFMNSVWKQFYVTKIEVSDSQMALILTYGAFANSIVRVMSGLALQTYDFKYIYLLLVCSTAFCCFTINFTLVSYFIGIIYSMTVFGGIGVQVTIFPTVCTKVFGPVVGPKMFPFVFSFFSMANLTQYFMLKCTDDWGFMFVTYGIIACIGIAFGVIFDSNPDWREQNYEYQRELIDQDEDQELIPPNK